MTHPTRKPARTTRTAAELLDQLDTPAWHAAGSTSSPPEIPTQHTVRTGIPINHRILDHITTQDDAVHRFIAQARAAGVPGPDPAPGNRSAVYREAHRSADLLGDLWPGYLALREWTAAAETLLLMGDTSVVRREPCPACRTWGLVWDRAAQRAICINAHCAQRNRGLHHEWTTVQLAREALSRRPDRVAR